MTAMTLPLFPLNLVLYPGMFLPLHIFEPRYKAMITHCLEEEIPFGVLLIEDGVAQSSGLARPHSIGTTAKIVQVQHTQGGRMNIWTLGEDRFEVLDYIETEDEYLLGQVRKLEEPFSDPLLISTNTDLLAENFRTYLELMISLSDKEIESLEYDLAPDPNTLSYQIAAMLDIDLTEKQNLLELNDLPARLALEAELLERETAVLQNLVDMQDEYEDILAQHDGSRTQSLPWGGEVHLN